jgi:hypothetical protein
VARNLERIVLTVITRTGYPYRGADVARQDFGFGRERAQVRCPAGPGRPGAGAADDFVQSHRIHLLPVIVTLNPAMITFGELVPD